MPNIVKTLLVAIVACGAASCAYAQEAVRPADSTRRVAPVVRIKPKLPKAIKHEWSGGLRLNSDGWSLYTDYGTVKGKDPRQIDMFHNVRIWQLEFEEKKHAREYKSTSNNGTGANSYIYGKINNMYAVKLGWGVRSLVAGKPDPGTVSIHWVNAGGLAIGMLKPYYINVYSDPAAIRYNEANKSNFLSQELIEGSAGFSKGLSEISFVPGGHFKSALHFDFAANRKGVAAVEAGMNIEYYSKEIQLMASEKATSAFFNIFLAVQFGKRW